MVYDVELKIGKVLKQIMAQQRHTLATMSKANCRLNSFKPPEKPELGYLIGETKYRFCQ